MNEAILTLETVLMKQACKYRPNSGGQVTEARISARRLHKADREKLRRDKLNEQFTELANALDPDRPKNDKATILGESIQVVKELREEVKRLKTEHASLVDESSELTQEKNELREEKASLKSETERLQNQVQHRSRSPSPWMALDPSLMMGPTAAYPYPIPVPQPVSLAQSETIQVGGPRAPLVGPTPFIPMPPPGPFHMHPTLQPYAVFGNRLGDGGNPFLPFSGFPPPVSAQSHIERPYAQYPSSVQQHVPGYAIQMSSSQGSPSSGSPLYRPSVPGIPIIPAQSRASSPLSKDSSDNPPTSKCSSPHETRAETEREIGEDVAAHDTESPVKLAKTPSEPPDAELKNVELESSESNAINAPSPTSMGKEKLGLYLERSTLSSLISKRQVQDLTNDSEAEHDPTLRPPAA
ncbi:hypothetical protein GOP47_0001699 [Adiantum capillus-veneris]|uniref:BHLH domain-containing protein n=1 Tax=Adiantum capillus-veneris TaxID=13818 RepID=A0A9D4ZQA0_ADICA|nr:hypothetical protein GOP47_0001699 [Adiantum capillus-veneris]